MRKTIKNLKQDSWSLGQDTNVVAPKQEAAMLPTQPLPLMLDFCEDSNETLGSIKCKALFNKLSEY